MTVDMNECWVCRRTKKELEAIEKGAQTGRKLEIYDQIEEVWLCTTCREVVNQVICLYFGSDLVFKDDYESRLKELEEKLQSKIDDLDEFIGELLIIHDMHPHLMGKMHD